MNDDVIRLRAVIDPLVQRKPQPKLFIKTGEETDIAKAEKDAEDINKWSMYNAYR